MGAPGQYRWHQPDHQPVQGRQSQATSSRAPITVLATGSAGLYPNGVNTDCYRLNISPLTNNTNYTIAVQARTGEKISDVHDGVNPDASATAMPSINASAAIVQTNTAIV